MSALSYWSFSLPSGSVGWEGRPAVVLITRIVKERQGGNRRERRKKKPKSGVCSALGFPGGDGKAQGCSRDAGFGVGRCRDGAGSQRDGVWSRGRGHVLPENSHRPFPPSGGCSIHGVNSNVTLDPWRMAEVRERKEPLILLASIP